MAEFINATDSLNEGRNKINRSMQQAERAEDKSDKAIKDSDEALTTSESVRDEFNQVVIDGDSSVEAAQARVAADGTTYPVLKERLDGEQEKVAAQLEQTDLSLNGQDYVNMFSNTTFETVGIKKVSATEYKLFAENIDKGVYYILRKNSNDDYFQLGRSGHYINRANQPVEITTTGSGWVKSYVNWYTTQVGDTFQFDFEGRYLNLVTTVSPNGGTFALFLDGIRINDLHTYREDGTTIQFNHPILDAKTYGTHTLKGVFLGPPEGTDVEVTDMRGWIHTTGTRYFSEDSTRELMHSVSNKEGAFTIREGGNSFWVPDHGQGVMENVEISYRVSGETLELQEGMPGMLNITDPVLGNMVEIRIVTDLVNPVTNEKFANFRMVYQLNDKGVLTYRGHINPTKKLRITTGYPLMMPLSANLNIIQTNNGVEIRNNGDNEYHSVDDKTKYVTGGFSKTTKSGYGQYVVYSNVLEYGNTMDLENNPEVSTFVWNRPDLLKLYFKALDNRDFEVGENYTWAGQFGIGMFPDNSYF